MKNNAPNNTMTYIESNLKVTPKTKDELLVEFFNLNLAINTESVKAEDKTTEIKNRIFQKIQEQKELIETLGYDLFEPLMRLGKNENLISLAKSENPEKGKIFIAIFDFKEYPTNLEIIIGLAQMKLTASHNTTRNFFSCLMNWRENIQAKALLKYVINHNIDDSSDPTLWEGYNFYKKFIEHQKSKHLIEKERAHSFDWTGDTIKGMTNTALSFLGATTPELTAERNLDLNERQRSFSFEWIEETTKSMANTMLSLLDAPPPAFIEEHNSNQGTYLELFSDIDSRSHTFLLIIKNIRASLIHQKTLKPEADSSQAVVIYGTNLKRTNETQVTVYTPSEDSILTKEVNKKDKKIKKMTEDKKIMKKKIRKAKFYLYKLINFIDANAMDKMEPHAELNPTRYENIKEWTELELSNCESSSSDESSDEDVKKKSMK